MDSEKIGKGKPVNPKADSEVVNVPPQVKSVPSHHKNTEDNTNTMVQSAKNELKRKRSSPEKKIDKERKTSGSHKKSILSKIEGCFGHAPEKYENQDTIDKYVISAMRSALSSTEPLSTERIANIHNLLVSPEFENLMKLYGANPPDPINPHPIWVFETLHDCIRRLDKYASFEEVLKARAIYLEENEVVGAFMQVPQDKKEGIFEKVVAKIPNLRKILDDCPLYSAADYTGMATANYVYFLRDTSNQYKWVFKPTTQLNDGEKWQIHASIPYSNALHEQLASLLNFHQGFPIPAVYQVEIMGHIGSVQVFLENAVPEITDETKISVVDFQTMAIFDVLFANEDRHGNNFLTVPEGDSYRVYGIDHDACMRNSGVDLKIQILDQPAFTQPFDANLRELVSEASIKKYKDIMKTNGIEHSMIEWMETAAETFVQAFIDRTDAGEIIAKLIQVYHNKFVPD